MTESQIDLSQGAALWRRLAALVYDSFLLLALSMGYGAIVTLITYMINGDTTQGTNMLMTKSELSRWLTLLGWVMTLASFYIFFWRRAGQTAGMRAWRLKVVQSENQVQVALPTFKQGCLRASLAIISLVTCGAGYWWHWFDKNGDCFHDKYSKTRVILTPPRKKK